MTVAMAASDTEAVVGEFVRAVWNGEDLEAIDRLTTPDFVLHQLVAKEDHDRDGFRAFQRRFHEAIPDFSVTIEDLVVDGADAVAHVTVSGTPEKPMQAIRPTGASFAVDAFQKYRLQDGRVAEVWVMVDAVGTMRQLGLFPPTPARLLRMALGTARARLVGR